MSDQNNWWRLLQQDVVPYKDSVFVENTTLHHTDSSEWDGVFMDIALEMREMSKCASRKIAAILVKDGNILSMGINGSPKGSKLCQDRNATCPRKKLNLESGKGLEYCPAQHAEINCISKAARNGIAIEGSTMYIAGNISPCKSCMGALINAGIKRVVFTGGWYDDLAEYLAEESNINIG